MDLRLILVLCALAATQAASVKDIQSGQCAKQCQSSELNEYENGKTYFYKYSARTLINSWNTDVDLKGDVLITRLTTCDYALELRNLVIKGMPNAKPLEDALKANSMKFTWIDGQIADVCHHPDEEDWVINVKKSIISSLQLVGTGGYVKKIERDVLGDCETTYTQQDLTSEKIVIKKTKNIVTCRNHHDEPIAAAIEALWTPGQPDYHCQQIWSNKYVLKSVKCGHIAAVESTIMANLTMEHVATKSKTMVSPLNQFRRTHLLAHHVGPVKVSPSEVSSSLINLCQSIENEVKPVAPQQFREFVNSLEGLNYDELKQVWQSMESNQFKKQCRTERIKTIFSDALIQCRSGPALKLMVKDLVKNQLVSEMKLKAVMHSLVYKVRPCEATMEAIIELLESGRQLRQSLFGITASIQKFYELGYDRQLASRAFDLVLKRFNQASEEDKVIIARALSNVHFDNDKIVKALEQYIERGQPELRIAAIETLEEAALCQDSVVSKLEKLIYRTNEPNEIRFRALKVFLRCADEQAVNQLKSYIVSTRGDEHFVSYADSYLRNALRTMNPDKQIVKEVAGLGQQTWTAPKATVARNLEFSRVTREGLIGFSYEVDSIVEDGKQVPTWVVMNASIPVRRENTLNFEMGVRQEGLERLTSKLMDRMNKINVNQWQEIAREAKDRRDYQPIVKELTKILEDIQRLVKENGKISAYIKVNGITLFYWNGKVSSADKMESYRRFIMENTDVNKMIETGLGWIFVDYKVHVPLVSGLVLRYKNEGSFVPGVKASIKRESQGVHSFGLFPNFALEYTFGRELILHKPIASEVRKSTFGSTAFVKGQRKYEKNDKESYTFSIDASEPEMELFRVKSVKIIRSADGKVMKESRNQFEREWCSTEYTDKIFGMAFCFEAKSEVEALPINKNFDLRCYAMKTDKSLKAYELVAERKEGLLRLAIDTPGSKVNRRVEIMLGQEGDRTIQRNSKGRWTITINSPVKNIQGTAAYAFPSGEQWFVSLEGQSDRRAHSVRVALEQPNANKQRVLNLMVNSPLLREKIDYDLTFSKAQDAVSGQIHANTAGKRIRLASLKLKRAQTEKKLGTIELELNNKQSEKLMSLMTEAGYIGEFPAITAAHVTSKIDYRRRQGKMENIAWTGAVKIDKTGEAKSASTKMELKTTQWPKVNGKFAHKMFYKPREHLENDMELRWGRDYDQESTLNQIIIHQVTAMKVERNIHDLRSEVRIENKARRFNHKLNIQMNFIPRSLDQLKIVANHMDLNRPEVQQSFTFEHKLAGQSEGTSSITLVLQPVTRSLKTTYSWDQSTPKVALIYKREQKGSNVQGYHANIVLNKASRENVFTTEVTTHPDNRAVFKSEINFARSMHKADVLAKIFVQGSNVFTGKYNRNRQIVKSEWEIPNVGKMETVVDGKAKSFSLLTKDSKSWAHQIEASAGAKKSFKAVTKQGVRLIPDVEINCEGQNAKMLVTSPEYTFTSELNNWASRPVFFVEFQCAKHGDSHRTEFNWLESSKLFKSHHKSRGQSIYECELSHEKKSSEYQTKMSLKGRQGYEAAFQSAYDVYKRSSKFDLKAKAGLYEGTFSSIVSFPTNRAKFVQLEDLPKVDIRANLKKADKESSLTFTSDKIVKLHVQHKTQTGVRFVFETKLDQNKLSVAGHADNLKWTISVAPKGSRKSVNWLIERPGMRSVLKMEVDEQGSQWALKGDSEFMLNGQQYWNGDILAKIAKQNRLAGPHELEIKDKEGNALFMTYKLKDNLEMVFKVLNRNEKVIETKFSGNKKVHQREIGLDGTLEISSDQTKTLKNGLKYTIKYNRNGGKVDLLAKKSGDNAITLKVDADVARESAIITGELSGRNQDGKFQKLVVNYKRMDKISFDAKLFESQNVNDEVAVSIPLVNVANFFGNEIILNFKSKSLNSEARVELKAPKKNLITGLIDIKIKGQNWLQYNANVDDGKSIRFYGMETIRSEDQDQIALTQELIFKGKNVFNHHIIVAGQNFVSFKVEVPKILSMDTSFLVKGDKPGAMGRYCWKESCTKMNSKFLLGRQGWLEMNIESPMIKKAVVNGKWNLEEGKEFGSMVVQINSRRYGHEWSRKVQDDKNAVYSVKLHLPQRTMFIETTKKVQTASSDKFIGSYIIRLQPKENAKFVTITLDRSVKRTGTNFKATHVITLEHQSLDKPVKIVTDVDYVKSTQPGQNVFGFKSQDIKIGVNYEGEQTHDINNNIKWTMDNGKMNYDWRVWHKEGKLDFGCKGLYDQEAKWQEKLLKQAQDYTCHWVDRNGKRRELKRDQAFSFKPLSDVLRIDFHDNMEHPLSAYFYNGTFNLAEALKDATIDFDTKTGQKYRLKAFLDTSKRDKCLEMTIFEVSEPESKYGLRSCLNLKPRSGDSFYLFQLITFTGQTPMVNGNKALDFSIKRMRNYVNDYLISLQWDQDKIGLASVQAIDVVEAMSQKRTKFIEERDHEIHDKLNFFKTHLGDRVNVIKRQWYNDVNEIFDELRPEGKLAKNFIAKALPMIRVRRAIQWRESNQVDLTSPMSYEWKVYDPENGHLELILRNVEATKVPRFIVEILRKNSMI